MTLEASTSRVQYATNGTTGPFAVPFYFLANTHLQVVYTPATGISETLTLTTHYSVSGAANPAGGSVTTVTAYPSGGTITIVRSVPLTQLTDYEDGDRFPAESHETALDKLTMIDQQQQEVLNRALVLSVASSGVSTRLPTPEANKILAWNSAADALENVSTPLASGTQLSAVNVLFAQSNANAMLLQMGFVDAYGADPTGAADSSAAISMALTASGGRARFGSGTYKYNLILTDNVIFEGAGSNETFWSPFDTDQACVTYRKGPPYWTYHTQFRDACFKGTGKVGVGFTFGRTDPNDFVTGDQYFNNVVFRNVDFRGLRKGIQFPAGNIGSEFYSCGFHDNFYGAYLLDNKFGGDIMHAGNKYWTGGEWSGNDCALYISNTTVGFGGIGLKDVIIEYNKIGIYSALTGEQFLPIDFHNVWFEGNGQTTGTSAETVTIDLWTGSTRSDQALTKRTFIFDGTHARYNITGGNFTDANVAATDAFVYCFNSNVEKNSGYLGGPVDVNTGRVVFDSCYSDGGFPIGFGVLCKGLTKTTDVALDTVAGNGSRRGMLTTARRSRIPSLLPDGVAQPFLTAQTLTGTFSLVGSLVTDGQVFSTCNEFTRASWAAAEYSGLTGASYTTTGAGWFVITVDVRVTVGAPKFYIWDRGSTTLLATEIPTPRIGNWFTVAAIGYASGAGKTFYFDVGNPATTQNITFRLSAFQCQRFDSQALAMDFLDSEAYSYAGAATGWTADTGTDKRTANATYSGTASGSYTQAELQAVMDSLRDATRTIKSLKADLIAQGIIGT